MAMVIEKDNCVCETCISKLTNCWPDHESSFFFLLFPFFFDKRGQAGGRLSKGLKNVLMELPDLSLICRLIYFKRFDEMLVLRLISWWSWKLNTIDWLSLVVLKHCVTVLSTLNRFPSPLDRPKIYGVASGLTHPHKTKVYVSMPAKGTSTHHYHYHSQTKRTSPGHTRTRTEIVEFNASPSKVRATLSILRSRQGQCSLSRQRMESVLPHFTWE